MEAFRTRFYKPLLALLALILVLASGFFQKGLNRYRDDEGLTRIEHLENAPPVLAFTTVALGGFRGLISNALWMRLSDMQLEGKYFEMVQLADWITKLQPHFEAVWTHLAWNLSYNISVKFEAPEDRWKWVQRGIELIRDEALVYNPHEVALYQQLAWLFQHKLGANLDDAHLHYKAMWANHMKGLLGFRPDWEVLKNPQTDEDQERVRVLKEVYKLDPALMEEVDLAYGPLEWRLPEAHAVYWAVLGLREVEARMQRDQKGLEIAKDKDFITLRRVIYQSMQLAFRRGRMIDVPYDETMNGFDLGPNLDLMPNVNQVYLDAMRDDPDSADHYANGHRSLLSDAVYFFYVANRQKEANEWFQYFKDLYPEKAPMNKSIEQFSIERVTDIADDTDRDRVKIVLEGLLAQAFYSLAIGEEEQSFQYERMAAVIHSNYTQTVSKAGGDSQIGRIGFYPLPTIKKQVMDVMLDPASGALSAYLRAALRTELGLPAVDESQPSNPASGQVPAPESSEETSTNVTQ